MTLASRPGLAPGQPQDAAQSLEQRRASYAWDCVRRSAARVAIKDYTSLAKGAPALIMTSGLMPTLAYLKAKSQKGKGIHAELLDAICSWLGRSLGGTPIGTSERFPPEPAADFQSVMDALCAGPSSLYMRATEESLAILRWIRQFADAQKAIEG